MIYWGSKYFAYCILLWLPSYGAFVIILPLSESLWVQQDFINLWTNVKLGSVLKLYFPLYHSHGFLSWNLHTKREIKQICWRDVVGELNALLVGGWLHVKLTILVQISIYFIFWVITHYKTMLWLQRLMLVSIQHHLR